MGNLGRTVSLVTLGLALVVVAVVLVAKEFIENKWFSAGVNVFFLVLLIVAWVMVGSALGHAGPPPPQQP